MDVAPETTEPSPPPLSYGALFLRFLGFGCLAFGGPVAQIAMIRRRLVEEEGWMSGARFNRLLAVMQVLPGPEAHELCVHLGMRAKGRLGGLLAGLGFMAPGFLLMLGVAWLYTTLDVRSGWIAAALMGLQVAVLAVIARAVHRIGRHVLRNRLLWATGAACLAASLAGAPFWLTLPAAGGAYALARAGRPALAAGAAALAVVAAVAVVLVAGRPSFALAPVASGDASAWLLFLSGLKAGLLTFGGAYTAIPFMRSDIVGRGWAADSQFLDGVAFAQVIPAPLIIFGTFVGYLAGGLPGAAAVTAGVFLPAFAFSMLFYDRLEAVLEHAPLHAFLDGVAAGVVGLIAATTLQMALSTIGEVSNPVAAGVMFLGAAAAIYAWDSRYAAPLVLLAAAGIGALIF